MSKSKELFERSLKVVPGGVHSPVRSFKGLHTTPRFIQRTSQAYLYDEDGKNYIDFCMSFGPLILGHRDPDVEKQILEAIPKGWTYGACEKYFLELAEYIISHLGFVDQIRFMNSGTEAVMTAIRLARGYSKKEKIIKFNGCYHGHLDSMLIKSGSGLAGSSEASSLGVNQEVAHGTLIAELNDINSVRLLFEKYPTQIAAVIIEPLPANYGLLQQTEDFLQLLRNLCDEYKTLLIFDEVISGFRINFGGMSCTTKIYPDIVTYGKIIGGGMPVGAVAGKKEIMQSLAPLGGVYQAGTLSANPVAMTAGLATLKKINQPNFYENLNKTTQKYVQEFKNWLQQYNQGQFAHYDIAQRQSLFWFYPKNHQTEVIRNLSQLNNIDKNFYHLFQVLLEKGIYLAPNGYEVGFMSYAHEKDEVFEELKKRLWT